MWSVERAFASDTVALDLELYEGVEQARIGKEIAASRQWQDSLYVVTVKNSSAHDRFLGIRIVARPELRGPASFWDGLNEHELTAQPCRRNEINDTFPMACVWNRTDGVALGFDPDTLYSYLATSVERGRFTYETRVVLKPGRSAEVRFVAYRFKPWWGWRSALDEYYRKFPTSFRPDPRVDPRIVFGTEAGANAYTLWNYSPYPELFRRLRATYGWCYAAFKRGDDFYGRDELWEWERPAEEAQKELEWVWGRTNAVDYRAIRRQYFDNGKPANCANLFYLSNCIANGHTGTADYGWPPGSSRMSQVADEKRALIWDLIGANSFYLGYDNRCNHRGLGGNVAWWDGRVAWQEPARWFFSGCCTWPQR